MYEQFDDDEQPSRGKAVALVVVLAIGGWFGYQKLTGGEDAGAELRLDAPPTSPVVTVAPVESGPSPTRPATTERPGPSAAPTTSPAVSPTPPSTTVGTTTAMATTTTTATTATTATIAPTPTPTPTSTTPAAPGSRLPNGVAVGALVTFDGAAVTMSGALPTAQARDRLAMFVAAANVTGKPIVNEVAVDADAPGGDSVRFVGLDPRAFPEGTNDIYPPHAAELDRIAELLNAFPDVAVIVVGRADQRGSFERNLGIAEDRAEALVAHLVSQGVDPDRLSSVAFGELDPAVPDDNVVALALNRRAEFVLYGLAN